MPANSEYPIVKDQTMPFDDLEPEHHYQNCEITFAHDALKLSDVILDHCTFQQANFSAGEWLDCTIKRCCFLNADFRNCQFYRCTMTGNQLIGADFTGSHLKAVTLNDNQADYANFSETTLDQVSFNSTHLQESAFQAVSIKHSLSFNQCTLTSADFSDTPLKLVDLRTSEIDDLRFSPQLAVGCTIDSFQAITFALALGVRIKD